MLNPAVKCNLIKFNPLIKVKKHKTDSRGGLFNLTWRDVDLVGKRITVAGNASKAVQTHISLLKMKLFKH